MSRTIQSVDDLAQLPDDELLACLAALRDAIHEAKRQHAAALRERKLPEGSPFTFTSYNWRQRGSRRLDMLPQLSPETPIDEIPVRPSAQDALKNLSIFCIEDLSAISEEELLKEEAIGQKTVGRLREVLARVGMDFLPNPHPNPNASPVRLNDRDDQAEAEPHFIEVGHASAEGPRQLRDTSESMDWMGLYDYPTQLRRLQPGDTGVFVCPPGWRGRLGTVCGIWVKGNTDWLAGLPGGTPWKQVFWTEAHPDGLSVVRAPLPGQSANALRTNFRFLPQMLPPLPEKGRPRLDQVVSRWNDGRRANGGRLSDALAE